MVIGPPRPGSQSASADVKVLTRLERDLRKAQGADRLESVNFAELDRAFLKSANPADRQRLIYSWLLYVGNCLEFQGHECRIAVAFAEMLATLDGGETVPELQKRNAGRPTH